ncbi:hypothetical protein BD309DRAFT_1024780 [Dichomitus squalens]|nr:hypothetical protein BD309DRAFT_1024780 [Dichomitus squalens]
MRDWYDSTVKPLAETKQHRFEALVTRAREWGLRNASFHAQAVPSMSQDKDVEEERERVKRLQSRKLRQGVVRKRTHCG